MSDLKLDMERLDTLRSDLERIIADFKSADDFSDSVADATGDDHLAGKVRDFAHAWDQKRKNMVESVEDLEKSVAAITDNFTKVDQQFAQALEKGSSGSSGTASSGAGSKAK